MYFYIYDTFLNERRFERDLAHIETKLMDLGIAGKIGRLSPFTNARGLIRDEVRRGVQTIVAVGNDETVAKVVDGMGDVNAALAIIPVASPSNIAESLGIPVGLEACEILSRRLVQRVDLGSVNGHLFLSDVRLHGQGVKLDYGSYQVSCTTPDSEIIVSNMRCGELFQGDESSPVGDPMDGILDALVISKKSAGLLNRFFGGVQWERSVLPTRRVNIIKDGPVEMVVDGRRLSLENVSIEVLPGKLKVVTGRSRAFAQTPDVAAVMPEAEPHLVEMSRFHQEDEQKENQPQ